MFKPQRINIVRVNSIRLRPERMNIDRVNSKMKTPDDE